MSFFMFFFGWNVLHKFEKKIGGNFQQFWQKITRIFSFLGLDILPNYFVPNMSH
jgi:hypothetical protein